MMPAETPSTVWQAMHAACEKICLPWPATVVESGSTGGRF